MECVLEIFFVAFFLCSYSMKVSLGEYWNQAFFHDPQGAVGGVWRHPIFHWNHHYIRRVRSLKAYSFKDSSHQSIITSSHHIGRMILFILEYAVRYLMVPGRVENWVLLVDLTGCGMSMAASSTFRFLAWTFRSLKRQQPKNKKKRYRRHPGTPLLSILKLRYWRKHGLKFELWFVIHNYFDVFWMMKVQLCAHDNCKRLTRHTDSMQTCFDGSGNAHCTSIPIIRHWRCRQFWNRSRIQ